MPEIDLDFIDLHARDAAQGDTLAAKHFLIGLNRYIQEASNIPVVAKKYFNTCTTKLKNGVDPVRALNLGGKTGPKYDPDAWQKDYRIAEKVIFKTYEGYKVKEAIELVATEENYGISTIQGFYNKYSKAIKIIHEAQHE